MLILFDIGFQASRQNFFFTVYLKSVCNIVTVKRPPHFSWALLHFTFSVGDTDQPRCRWGPGTFPTEGRAGFLSCAGSTVCIDTCTCSRSEPAGTGWAFLTAKNWDQQQNKYAANTQEDILNSLCPCTGPQWGQTSTQQVWPIAGGWREIILFLFSSLSKSNVFCISVPWMKALGLNWGHSSGLDPVTYLPWWHSGGGGKGKAVTRDGSACVTASPCHSGGLWESPHVQIHTCNCRIQEGS